MPILQILHNQFFVQICETSGPLVVFSLSVYPESNFPLWIFLT